MAERLAVTIPFELLAPRVVLGWGALDDLPAELAGEGYGRVVLVPSSSAGAVAERLASRLGPAYGGTVAAAAGAGRPGTAFDAVVALGGGTAMTAGKSFAAAHGVPMVAVPTSYGGCAMTGAPPAALRPAPGAEGPPMPALVVADPGLTTSLPRNATVTGGLMAMSHAVAGLYAVDSTPSVRWASVAALRALVAALPACAADPRDRAARTDALRGACLAGCAWANVPGGMTGIVGVQHAVAAALATADRSVAAVHAALLPYWIAWNGGRDAGDVATVGDVTTTVGDATATVADVLGAPDAAGGMWDLARRLGGPRLRDLEVTEEVLATVIETVLATPLPSARPATRTSVAELVSAAWTGERP